MNFGCLSYTQAGKMAIPPEILSGSTYPIVIDSKDNANLDLLIAVMSAIERGFVDGPDGKQVFPIIKTKSGISTVMVSMGTIWVSPVTDIRDLAAKIQAAMEPIGSSECSTVKATHPTVTTLTKSTTHTVTTVVTEGSIPSDTKGRVLYVGVNNPNSNSDSTFIWRIMPITGYLKEFSNPSALRGRVDLQEMYSQVFNGILYTDGIVSIPVEKSEVSTIFDIQRHIVAANRYVENAEVVVYRENHGPGVRSPILNLTMYDDPTAPVDRFQGPSFRPLHVINHDNPDQTPNNVRDANWSDIESVIYEGNQGGKDYCECCKQRLFGTVYGLVAPIKYHEEVHMVHLVCPICAHTIGGIRTLGATYKLILKINHPRSVEQHIEEFSQHNEDSKSCEEWKTLNRLLLKNPITEIHKIQYAFKGRENPKTHCNRYALIGDSAIAVEYPAKFIFSKISNDPEFSGRTIYPLAFKGKLYAPTHTDGD